MFALRLILVVLLLAAVAEMGLTQQQDATADIINNKFPYLNVKGVGKLVGELGKQFAGAENSTLGDVTEADPTFEDLYDKIFGSKIQKIAEVVKFRGIVVPTNDQAALILCEPELLSLLSEKTKVALANASYDINSAESQRKLCNDALNGNLPEAVKDALAYYPDELYRAAQNDVSNIGNWLKENLDEADSKE